jgi:hypothetical protein
MSHVGDPPATGSIGAAAGAALALKRTTGSVAVPSFADRAIGQGCCFEGLDHAQSCRPLR